MGSASPHNRAARMAYPGTAAPGATPQDVLLLVLPFWASCAWSCGGGSSSSNNNSGNTEISCKCPIKTVLCPRPSCRANTAPQDGDGVGTTHAVQLCLVSGLCTCHSLSSSIKSMSMRSRMIMSGLSSATASPLAGRGRSLSQEVRRLGPSGSVLRCPGGQAASAAPRAKRPA